MEMEMEIETNDVRSVRTLEIIACEIMAIKKQTQKILLVSAIEIGRRLIEAKEIIPYGEFSSWLEKKVNYSNTTAYNLMNLAQGYGSTAQTTTLPDNFSKLGYTQALILLGLPEEERAEFIAQFDLESMSSRELQKVVTDRNQALEAKAVLEIECSDQKKTISALTEERDKTKKDAEAKQQALRNEKGNVTLLQRRLDQLENDSAAARHIAEVELSCKVAKINVSMAQADARFDLLVKGFEDLFSSIVEMSAADPQAFKHYLVQTNKFLAKTTNKLKRIEKNAQE